MAITLDMRTAISPGQWQPISLAIIWPYRWIGTVCFRAEIGIAKKNGIPDRENIPKPYAARSPEPTDFLWVSEEGSALKDLILPFSLRWVIEIN